MTGDAVAVLTDPLVLAPAPVGAGARPVVGLAGDLNVVETVLLRETIDAPPVPRGPADATGAPADDPIHS